MWYKFWIYNECANDDNHKRNINKQLNGLIFLRNHFNSEVTNAPDGDPPNIHKCDNKKSAEFFIWIHSM